MKTKLHPAIWILLLALGFNVIHLSAQTKDQTISSQETLPPLVCDAPIDPAWLQQAKVRDITSKDFDEPIVRVAYLIPSNRSPQPKGVEALQLVIRSGRDFFRDEMTYNRHTPKTFRYETEADGETPLIHVVNIPETDAEIEGSAPIDHWNNMINSARNQGLTVWKRGEIWILVSESHRQQPDGSIVAGGALGAGGGNADDPGVATMTSTFLTPFAEGALTNDQAYDGMLIPEIGPYPLKQGISFSSFNGTSLSSIASVTLGAFLHELTHAFGLGHHDFRNDASFHGNLLGNGFRGIRGHLYPEKYPDDYTRLAYASALVLNTSHYFNPGKQRNLVDEVVFNLQSSEPQDGKLVFNVTANDTDGLSMLHLFSIQSRSVERVLTGNSFNGQIMLPYFEPGTQTSFRLKLYDQQGNKTERIITATPRPGNRAPWPFVKILPPIGEAGDTFGLNWVGSFDPDTGSEVKSSWDIAWDLDNDDVFDVPQQQSQSSDPTTRVNLAAGNHLVRLKLIEPSGAQSISTPVAVHVAGNPPPPTEVSFTLIDVFTNKAIPGFDPIPEGAELDIASLPTTLSIRANVPAHYESVRFDFDGEANFRVENLLPYSLYGDIEGDYAGGSFSTSAGLHTVSATPFTQDGAQGVSGPKGILRFTMVMESVSFILVDADTDEDLFSMENGIDSFSIINKNLNIRTSHAPREDLKVHFRLTGPINRTWTEQKFPFALFGDINGNYNGVKLPAGIYTLKADFEFLFGACCESSQLSHEITFEIEESEIAWFAIHADPFTGEPTEFADSGRTFFSNDLPFSRNVAITAQPQSFNEAGSIALAISGPITFSRIENIRPYSLFGDIDGDLNSRLFPEGEYELSATPYSEPNGQGIAGKTLIVSFKIIEGNYILNGAELGNVESGTFLDELLSADDGNTTFRSLVDNATVVLRYDCINGPCPGSVAMALSGPVTSSRIENELPFTLFGDQGGNFTGRSLPIGDYTLSITPYTQDDGMGVAGSTITADFSIVPDSKIPFVWTDTYSGPYNPFEVIEDGKTYFPTGGFNGVNSILALTYGGSVVLEISGPINHNQTENSDPYSLFGDVDFDFNTREFPDGAYTLTATTYSQANGQGAAGISSTITFKIERRFGTNLIILTDADTGNEIDNLYYSDDGNSIDIQETPTNNATILVAYEQCDLNCPGSVLLELDGPITTSRLENVQPFTIFGGIYGALNGRDFPVGNYTIAVTAFSGPNGTGTVNETQIRDFQIIDSGAFPLTQAIIYPNPARDNILLQTDIKSEITGNAVIYDFLGREVKRISHFDPGLEQNIDVSELAKGIYFVKIQVGSERITKKLIVK